MVSVAVPILIYLLVGVGWIDHPAVVGLIVAVPSSILGILAYLRSRRNDAVAEQAGISTAQTDSIGQVVAGQNTLIANLQDDNRSLREHVRDLTTRINQIIAECEELKRQVALLSA